jgi:hypothetical protein
MNMKQCAENLEQKQIGASEKNPGDTKETGVKETEAKYMKELEDYRRHTSEEILRIEAEFQEKVKTASPEELVLLKEEKDRRQALLRENLEKVKMNLEEGLVNQWQMEDK